MMRLFRSFNAECDRLIREGAKEIQDELDEEERRRGYWKDGVLIKPEPKVEVPWLCRLGFHLWVIYTIGPDNPDYKFRRPYTRRRHCERCHQVEYSGRGAYLQAWDDNNWRLEENHPDHPWRKTSR